jgi:hypothetical protein
MPYFDNEGIKIYYEIEGEGPPVEVMEKVINPMMRLIMDKK